MPVITTANEPLELARRLHDTVAQRLAGLSYLLATPDNGRVETLDRCRAEVDAALDELRDVLTSVGSAPQRDARTDALTELRLLRTQQPGAVLDVPLAGIMAVEPRSLVCAFLAEGLRNVRKHASPARVAVTVVRDADVVSIAILNDGVGSRRGPSCGAGRRLLEVEASLCGGLVESAPAAPGHWCQRLILPAAESCAA
jgi:signal transduction histidine kinase